MQILDQAAIAVLLVVKQGQGGLVASLGPATQLVQAVRGQQQCAREQQHADLRDRYILEWRGDSGLTPCANDCQSSNTPCGGFHQDNTLHPWRDDSIVPV